MFVCLLFVCLNAFYAVQSAGSAAAAVGSAGTQGVHCGATSASGQRWPMFVCLYVCILYLCKFVCSAEYRVQQLQGVHCGATSASG